MGIVNVTPDSFSDGGLHLAADRAIEQGLALSAAGADIVDVGGESTRPGAARVSAEEEKHRVLPVVRALAEAGITVSIDTMRADVADAALDAGVHIINDVSGGLADPDMPRCAAQARVPYIAMHWRAPSAEMHRHADYHDVVAEVTAELSRRLDALLAAGMGFEQIILDPGLGFAKNADHNWQLLRQLEVLHSLSRPILIGASRKSFLGRLSGENDVPGLRDDATAAVSALAAAAGAYCVRVHNVVPNLDAVRVAAAWVRRAENSPAVHLH
ncbi:dihydropteroate synthase [Streptomyces sp. NPDC013178]|uniref:dihydropteroate synthase n=1 Tax=Streptomyces sp. NPDC013178 TaxID=3155118 RepID=UPI0033F04DD4